MLREVWVVSLSEEILCYSGLFVGVIELSLWRGNFIDLMIY